MGVRRSITNFLTYVLRSGALMGTTQEEAFVVTRDRRTMTQDDIDNGRPIHSAASMIVPAASPVRTA